MSNITSRENIFGESTMYKPTKEQQISWFDSRFVCENLFAKNILYREIRRICDEFIQKIDFTPLYCPDNGRPAKPEVLMKALVLQRLFNLSDRQLEEACRFDIRYKYILDLELDDMGFDHSVFGKFRERLLASQKHKEALFELVKMIADAGLIKQNENQRTDSFHVIANVAIPAASELIREGIRICLRQLKRRHYDLFRQAQEKLDTTKYLEGELAKGLKPEPDEFLRRLRLTEVVGDAKALVAFLDRDLHPSVAYRRSVLIRLLYENTEPAEKGYKESKETHPDRIISAVDPEARHGAKSKTRKFNGYKAHVTETVESKFITNITVTPGNVTDSEPVVENTREIVSKAGLTPEKMIGDGAYGTGDNRQQLKEMGIQLVAPPRPQSLSEDLVNGKFSYDPEKQTVKCPAGITTAKKTYNENSQAFIFRFPKEACQTCELKDACTKNKNGRTISVNKYYQVQVEALEYSKTEEYKLEIRKRCPIEGTGAELVYYHGLRRARYWGCVQGRIPGCAHRACRKYQEMGQHQAGQPKAC